MVELFTWGALNRRDPGISLHDKGNVSQALCLGFKSQILGEHQKPRPCLLTHTHTHCLPTGFLNMSLFNSLLCPLTHSLARTPFPTSTQCRVTNGATLCSVKPKTCDISEGNIMNSSSVTRFCPRRLILECSLITDKQAVLG